MSIYLPIEHKINAVTQCLYILYLTTWKILKCNENIVKYSRQNNLILINRKMSLIINYIRWIHTTIWYLNDKIIWHKLLSINLINVVKLFRYVSCMKIIIHWRIILTNEIEKRLKHCIFVHFSQKCKVYKMFLSPVFSQLWLILLVYFVYFAYVFGLTFVCIVFLCFLLT